MRPARFPSRGLMVPALGANLCMAPRGDPCGGAACGNRELNPWVWLEGPTGSQGCRNMAAALTRRGATLAVSWGGISGPRVLWQSGPRVHTRGGPPWRRGCYEFITKVPLWAAPLWARRNLVVRLRD